MRLSAVTREHHSNKGWKPQSGFGFAQGDPLLPVLADELPRIVPMMPLAFFPAQSSFILVGVGALEPGHCLFIAPNGQWLGAYAPASLRSHPFRMAKPEGFDEPVLCVIEDTGSVVAAGQGESFFDSTGAPTQAIKEVVAFLQNVENNRLATQRAVDALGAAGVIQPWVLTASNAGVEKPVTGLFHIDQARLNDLGAPTLCKLQKDGALAIAYAQVFSEAQLNVFDKLKSLQATLSSKTAEMDRLTKVAMDRLTKGDTISFG